MSYAFTSLQEKSNVYLPAGKIISLLITFFPDLSTAFCYVLHASDEINR